MSDSMLPELLARELGRKYVVYVFPSWGDCKEVFAHDHVESGQRFLGMSERMWVEIQVRHSYRVGRALASGDRLDVHFVHPRCDAWEVYLSRDPICAGDAPFPVEMLIIHRPPKAKKPQKKPEPWEP